MTGDRRARPLALSEAQSSVRNAGLLVAQWAFHIAGAGLFAVVVPRLMGPETFGEYALLTSVAMWFAFLSGLGAVTVLTRAIPQLVAVGDLDAVRKLVTSLISLRALTGLFTASAYTLLMVFAFGFGDWAAVLLVAIAVWSRTAANICFAMFLALNKAAQWGMGDLLRRWLILIFIVLGFPIAGLRGACAGVLLANVVVLGLGLLQARPYLRWRERDLSRPYLTPFIRTGTAFAAGNLLITMVQRSGEAIVTVSIGDYAEVGYFGAAYAIYLTIAQAIWQSAITFAPLLIKQVYAGEIELTKVWLGRILKWILVAITPAAASMLILGPDLVPVLLGAEYRPVAVNLVPLAVALFSVAIASVARLSVLTLDRPRVLVVGAAIELSIFWMAGLLLAPRAGSLGVASAAALASVCYASWMTWRARRELAYPPRAALTIIGLAVVFLPLILSPFSLAVNAGLFAAVCGVYAWLLWHLGVVTLEEIVALRAVARRRTAPSVE